MRNAFNQSHYLRYYNQWKYPIQIHPCLPLHFVREVWYISAVAILAAVRGNLRMPPAWAEKLHKATLTELRGDDAASPS